MSIASHYLFTIIVLLLLGYSTKRSFLYGFIGFLPDIDFFFNIHRAIFHSVFIPLILVVLAIYMGKKYRHFLLLFSMIYALHIIMDLPFGPTAIFYPLSSQFFIINLSSGVHMETLMPTFEMTIETQSFTRNQIAAFSSMYYEGGLFSNFSFILLVGLVMVKIRNYVRECK